ncbi:MAG: hypothetical protein AABZ06_09760 [Bdellovibrionota bacterium]
MTITDKNITEIGSLPHHNIDAALDFSFRHGIPFLPQIPMRNPWEHMIAQAIEGLPGLSVENDGSVIINTDIWHTRADHLDKRLQNAFESAAQEPMAFEEFEPSASTSSSWQSFLWELTERRTKLAKVQIAGPMTVKWAIRTKDGSKLEEHGKLPSQIDRLIMARAIAMTRKLQAQGIKPILFIDEPGLYGGRPLNELENMINFLQKENVSTGLHCCSNTDWHKVLELNIDYLSFDVSLSLRNLLQNITKSNIRNIKFSFGIIPTGRPSALYSFDIHEARDLLFDNLMQCWDDSEGRLVVNKIIRDAIFTPACGIALHSVSDAELILELLSEFNDLCHEYIIAK